MHVVKPCPLHFGRALRAWAVTVTLACVQATFPIVTWAEDIDGAQRHFERAVRLHEEHAYDQALAEFRRAYELSPRYQVLFNIAQVHYQLNEYAEARRAFERYLAEGGDEIPAVRRAFVEGELEELAERVGTLEIVSETTGARVFLDDVELGEVPLAATAVDIGRHVVRIEQADGKETVRRIEVASGQNVRIELSSTGTDVSEFEGEPRTRRRITLWTIGSVGAALAVASGASLGVAVGANGTLDDRLAELPANPREVDATRRRVDRASLAADVLGAGAIAAAAGFVIALFVTKDEAPEAASQARVVVGPGTVGVRGSF